MAENQEKPVEEQKKKLPIKTIAVVGGVMLIEAALLVVGGMMFAGGPDTATADSLTEDATAEQFRRVEVLVIEDKFTNNKEGRTYIYDTAVYISVKKMHEESIMADLESMRGAIKEDMRILISQAEPGHLREPTLATLKRQLLAKLEERIPPDANGDGKSRIEEVMITKFIQVRTD